MKTHKHVSISIETSAVAVKFINDFHRALSFHLVFVIYIDGLNKMPDMSGKRRTDPTRDDKANKLYSKNVRRHQENSTNIAEVRTTTYADDVSNLATSSSRTQAQK